MTGDAARGKGSAVEKPAEGVRAKRIFEEFLEGRRTLFILRLVQLGFLCVVRSHNNSESYTRACASREDAENWKAVELEQGFNVEVEEVLIEELHVGDKKRGGIHLYLVIDGEGHFLSSGPLN